MQLNRRKRPQKMRKMVKKRLKNKLRLNHKGKSLQEGLVEYGVKNE